MARWRQAVELAIKEEDIEQLMVISRSRTEAASRPPGQWRSLRTTNAIERLHEEFKRRIKTQTVLPSADTAAMLFWALLASGQINMRKVDGWQTLATAPIAQPIDLAA
jgi:putative transposase